MAGGEAKLRSKRGWSVGLWVVQALLALLYVYAGAMKLTQSPEALASTLGWMWALSLPPLLIKVIGVLELLGAAGLVLPAATRILPGLTPLAATGLGVLQLAAIGLHAARGESGGTLWFNLLLLAASLFVLWGRTRRVPIEVRRQPRSIG